MKYLVSDKQLQVHIPLVCLGLSTALFSLAVILKAIQFIGLAVALLAPAYLAWVMRDDSLLKRFVRYSYWRKKSRQEKQKMFGEMCLLALKMDRPKAHGEALRKHNLSEEKLVEAISGIEMPASYEFWEDYLERAYIYFGRVEEISWHKLEEKTPNLISTLDSFLRSNDLVREIEKFKFNYFLKENKVFS